MNLSDLRRAMGRDAGDGPELSDSTLSAPLRPRRQSMDNMDLLKVRPARRAHPTGGGTEGRQRPGVAQLPAQTIVTGVRGLDRESCTIVVGMICWLVIAVFVLALHQFLFNLIFIEVHFLYQLF